MPGLLASVSVSVCVISIFLMLLASTLYHSMRPIPKHKAVFHKLDHIFIFVAIIGNLYPLALLVICNCAGVSSSPFCSGRPLCWVFCIRPLARRSIPALGLTLTIYLVMGWTAIFFTSADSGNASLPLLVLSPAGRDSLYGRSDRLCRRRDSATTTWSGICLSTWRCCRIWRGIVFFIG